jgi:putative PIN family toxin of toxin-antitoxin system
VFECDNAGHDLAPSSLSPTVRLKLVLDTNIVLDWLVFHDPDVTSLQRALEQGRVEIITHDPAIDELRRVLGYAHLALAIEQQQDVLVRYHSHTHRVTLPAGANLDDLRLPPGFPRCRDGDDQHFLALAWHARADALVSKDAAVLALSRRLRKFGVTVLDREQLAAALTS